MGSDLYEGKYVFDNSPVPGAPGLAVFETRAARLRARWIAGRPIYHESCFREHRLDQKRKYWAKRTEALNFRASERQRARKRRRA